MDHEQQPSADLPPAPPEDAASGVGTEPPPPPRRGKAIAIAAGIVAALALAGGVGAFFLLRGSGEQLLDKLPAETDAVLTVYLDPSASQKVNLLRMADEIPSLGSGEEINEQIEDALDGSLSILGLTHEDMDWVGSQVAISVNFPESGSADTPVVTALVATDDEAAASSTLTKLREDDPSASGWRAEDHAGVEVWVGSEGGGEVAYALVDGVVVFTNSTAAVDDVIATSSGQAETLAESADFQGATAELPEGRLALVYVNPSSLSQAIEDLGPTPFDPSVTSSTQTLEGITSIAMSLSAEEDGIALDTQVTFDPAALSPATRETLTVPAHANPLLAAIPSDALAAVSLGGVRATIDGVVRQLSEVSPEVAAAIDDGFIDALTGDLALAAMPAGPTDGVSGVVLIGTSDASAMSATIPAFVDALGQKTKWSTTDHDGVEVFTMIDRGNPSPYAFSYAVVDEAAILGFSPAAVFEVIDARQGTPSIVDEPAYRDAMATVPSDGSSIYVDIDGLAETIRSQLPPAQVADFDSSVGDTMDHLDAFVMGSAYSDTSAHLRMVLRVG